MSVLQLFGAALFFMSLCGIGFIALVAIGVGLYEIFFRQTKREKVNKVKTTNRSALQYTDLVPQGAANPWLIFSQVAKDGVKAFWENAFMGLKLKYVAVFNEGTQDIHHCQAAFDHPGGAIAVCINASMDKFGYIAEDVRMQGVFVGAVRGFKDPTAFGVETTVETLTRELAEEVGTKVNRYLPLALGVNGDNAFFIHSVTADKVGGNDYYLVIFPDENLIPTADGRWTVKQEVVTDKKLKGVVFESIDTFDPMASFGAGIDGFLLTGWLLFKNWLSSRPLTVEQAFNQLVSTIKTDLQK